MRNEDSHDKFSARLALVHEAEAKVEAAEATRSQRKTRVGRFFASIGVSKAENTLAHRNILYDQVLLARQLPKSRAEIVETPSRPELI